MNFVGKRYWFVRSSILIIIIGVTSLVMSGGLNPGLEFTGGASMTLEFEKDVDQGELRDSLSGLGYTDTVIQKVEDNSYFIRIVSLADTETAETSEREKILNGVNEDLGVRIRNSDYFSVSPTIAAETVRNAVIIVAIAAVAILFYITWAFRRIPSPFRYGFAAIIALIHDVLIVMGMFSILGRIWGLEVNAMFIAGILTIIGYSVHDTIVVFDRIRETLSRNVIRDLSTAINVSIEDTLGRSLNTSLTILFTILALMLFGGSTIIDFLVVLMIGIIVGTYSSICIASQILLIWENRELGQIFRKLPIPFLQR
ncbi:MAG: protein translocase subunit SecF [Dehalococcoidia bacterium]|nr:protein translocase subunit SecF [Chloroflexota bacterium]MCH2525075.1 protein translocase subunit SecF [Dehalococcoidia bacterium]